MGTKVRIYMPAKTPMQSGRGKSQYWIMEMEATSRRQPEPLMGWISAADTTNQVRLTFDTREAAVAFAERQGYDYSVTVARERKIRPRAYADNFITNRRFSWTH